MHDSHSPILCHEHHRVRSEAVDMHPTEDVCSIFMPLSTGEARVRRNGANLFAGQLRTGMLRVSVPEERSQVLFLSPVNLIELVVPGNSVRRAFEGAGYLWPSGPAKFTPLVRPNPSVAALAKAFQSSRDLHQEQRPEYLEGLTQALLACLIETGHFTVSMDVRSAGRRLNDSEFARCMDFALGNLGRKLCLDDWAATLNMGVGEFAQAFRKRTKESPYAWFLTRRIEHAKKLLRSRVLPLADIALSTGFCSQSHFTESFRRRVGCSPARWVQSSSEKPDGTVLRR